MLKRIRITNRVFILTIVLGSFLIMAMVTANTIWASKQTIAATNEAVSAVSSFYLEAMADNGAKTITNLINESFDEMEKAVSIIAKEKVESLEEYRSLIGKIKLLMSLNRFALVDVDNIVYTQYTTYTGRSRHSFLSGPEIKGRIISTVSLYGSSKQVCLVIPTPDLTVMGKRFKACFVQFDINDISELLAFDEKDRTHFALYAKNGSNLTGTELGPEISNHNLFEALKGIVTEDVLAESYSNFANETKGSLSFVLDNANETLCYVPIPGTGWELTVLIRKSLIEEQIQDISGKNIETSNRIIIFTLVSGLAFAIILLFEIGSLSQNKLEAEKEISRVFRNMATTDSMTGVRNRHAYLESEAAINRQIQEGTIQELAIVVCDINGLKYTNDTKGHTAGDQLIKDACTLICDYFAHGAVFRIGGDEFVVLLQGKGYNTVQEVIDELNRKIEANIKKNAVVIAIGFAVLSQEDQQLSTVFERADQMMYERKKELKAMSASNGHH